MFNINYTKVFLFLTVIIFCDCNNPQPAPVISGDTINEQDYAPPPPPPVPGVLPGNNMPPPEPQIVKEIDGMVINYAANKDDDIDKLLINANNDSLLFHFPPHTAKWLLAIAAKNSGVHIWYVDGRKPPNHNDKVQYELIAIQSKADNNKLNVHDIPPPPPEAGKEIILSSDKVQWQNNDAQNSNLILSGRLIALPPHAKESLLPLIKNAHSVLIKGYERSASTGFVNRSGLILVRPYAITIDSINYSIR